MKPNWLVAALAACMLAACGGGGDRTDAGADDNVPPTAGAVATAHGGVVGPLTTKMIGPAGGSLDSADGRVTLTVPPGALDTERAIGLQQVENTAHGGVGRSYRLTPEGLQSAQPMQLQLRYDDADLQGTDPGSLSVADQDAKGYWRIHSASTRDADHRALTVQTTHFSDWSLAAELWLRPGEATATPGSSLSLRIERCISGADPTDASVSVLEQCKELTIAEAGATAWAVDGVPGGNAGSIGSVVPAVPGDLTGSQAVYTAPPRVPVANPVAVSVEMSDLRKPNERLVLLSHVTIVQPGCDWVRTTPAFDVRVGIDPAQVSADTTDLSYTGTGAFDVVGRVVRISPASSTEPVVVFSSQGQDALFGGTVSVDGTTHVGGANPYDVGYHASGAPTGMKGVPPAGVDIPPGIVSMVVRTDTCTFTFGAGAFTLGRIDGGPTPNPAALLSPGTLHLSDAAVLDRIVDGRRVLADDIQLLSYVRDDGGTGFTPWTAELGSAFNPGHVAGSWSIIAVAP